MIALVDELLSKVRDKKRFILAVAGPPASGKSTLVENLHRGFLSRDVRAKIVPMDGFHLDNTALEALGLLSRKGAPQTFDAKGFVDLIARLRVQHNDIVIPTFDRHRDCVDPMGDVVSASDQVLLVEGNYVLLNQQPWSSLQPFWDESLFLDVDFSTLENRLINRWVEQGLQPQKARERASENDLINAQFVIDHSYSPTMRLPLDDAGEYLQG